MNYEKRLVLEGRRYSNDSVNLSRAALASGWDVLRVADYTYEDDGVRPVLYGSKWLGSVVERACGVSFVRPSPNWLATLGGGFAKREITHHVGPEIEWPDRPMFIKCCDSKWFSAKVYQPEEMPALAEFIDEDGIIISEPVHFEHEFRTFVLDGRVMDISSYMLDGEPTQTQNGWLSFPELEAQAVEFVEALIELDDIEWVPSLVVDVGRITGRGWAIIEANESWFSGLYACDPLKVLETIEGAVVDKERE